MSDREYTSAQAQRIGLIRKFCRQERVFAAVLIVFGLTGLTMGALMLTNLLGIRNAGIPLFLMSIPVIDFGTRAWLRARSFLPTGSENTNGAITAYMSRGEQFIEKINKTRNLSALLLLIGIVGILVACFVEALAFTVWTWIIVTATAALLSLAAYYHVFRLEIHLHEISREAPPEETGEKDG